jgi:4-amino-4-deoxy-L-arabinose transferase-like glycosyltransferase
MSLRCEWHARVRIRAHPALEPLQFPPALSRAAWIAIAAIIAIAWFAALDTRVLEHPDEGRYGEIAREMAVTGDYLTPRLNGLKYFEKPPLQYWVTAATYKVFEIDEWSTRFAPVVGGFMTILLVGFTLAKLVSPLAGAFGALVMSSMVLAIGMSHYATLDAFFTGWLTLALCAFLRAQQASLRAGVQRNFMLLAYAGLAAATMTKGPVALVIAGGSLVFYSLTTRDYAVWKRLHLAPGLLLFFALTAPWFILVSRANPEFAEFFFIHEHVERFLTTEHNRAGPLYYFVPLFGFGITPWLFVWAATFVRSWRDTGAEPNGFDWGRFCFVWALFVFAFFSLSGSKLPSYILPEFPAIALLLGRELVRMRARTLLLLSLPQLLASLGFLLFVLFGYHALIPHISGADRPAAMYVAYFPWLVKTGIVFVVGSMAAAWLFRTGTERAKVLGIFAIAACGLIGFQIAFVGHEVFNPIRSAAGLLRDAGNHPDGIIDPSAPVFQVGSYDQTFTFYLGRTTTLVDFRDEFSLGLDIEPGKAYPKYPRWIHDWTALPQGYALMKHDTYAFLLAQGVPMRIIASDPRRVLVARR